MRARLWPFEPGVKSHWHDSAQKLRRQARIRASREPDTGDRNPFRLRSTEDPALEVVTRNRGGKRRAVKSADNVVEKDQLRPAEEFCKDGSCPLLFAPGLGQNSNGMSKYSGGNRLN